MSYEDGDDKLCPKCHMMLCPYRENGEDGKGPWTYKCDSCGFSCFDYELDDELDDEVE